MPKYRIIPIGGGGGVTPTGTINITSNGDHNVAQYANASVAVPASAVDTGTLTIEPITSNVTLFTQDVVGYAALAFQVAVPASEVTSGTLQITSNGTQIDVTEKKYVDVNVQPNLTTLNATTNNTFTPTSPVQGYSSVTVNVPASAVDSGTKQITTNGNNQDVVGYAAVDVAVPAPYWEGTQVQYDALAPDYDNDTLYLITN